MANSLEDLVQGNARSGYGESIKKAQSVDTNYLKCRCCPNMTSKCPLAKCFKEKKKK